jgi:LuxR family maltose regulon positive regulatory protein
MLVRDRLLGRLRRRWSVPVTVVTAPAGYGKTTLLQQAARENASAAMGIDGWVACRPELAVASALGEALCAAVGAPRTPPGGVADVATAVADAMWRHSPQQVALVLDDVHEILPGSEAARLLAFLVGTLPANGHLVLAGRVPPPIPLARLEVEGRVERLTQDDLAFTDGELDDFATLRQVPRAKLSASGGWPALAELAASSRADLTGDYVGEEVLTQVPQFQRQALALLAHIGPFDDDLARAVLGIDVDVAGLVAGVPLVETLGDGNGERRLHALWQSVLDGEVTAADVAEARRRAGVALVARGRVDPGIRLLIRAEAWDDLADALVVALGAAHPPVAHDVLEEWSTLLPPAVRATPSGRLLAAVVAVEGDLGGAWQDFEECAAAFRAVGETSGELACLVQLGQVAWWSESSERLAAVAARAFELEAAGCEEAAPFACLGRALIYDIADASREMLAELDRIPKGSLSEPWLGIVNWARAIALLQLGETGAAEQAAERALSYAGSLHAPLAQGTRLQALWYQGRLAEVRDALPGHLDLVRASGYPNNTVLVASHCSVVHAFRGQPDRAARFLDEARTTGAHVPDAPLIDTSLAVAEAALAQVRGDEATASSVLSAYVGRHPVGQGLSVAAQRRHVALIYVLVPESRPVWDAAELGPAWSTGRALARAVVAVREQRPLPAEVTPLPDPGVVQAHLPPGWVAELAVAAVAAGREDGWQLLEATWPVTRPEVAALAGRSRGALRRAAREALGQLPLPPTRRLELRLLGPLQLRENGVPVRATGWRRERVRLLLAYLAIHGTVSRQQLAHDLWPALDTEAQSRNLRVTLTYLLQLLEPHRGKREASFFIRQHGGNLSLHAGEWLTVDLWEFDTLCQQAADADRRGATATALDRALQAVDLWQSEPIELVSEQWALAAVEQRRQRLTRVATRAGELLLARDDSDRALALAEQAIDVDPWLEAAHRLVVAAHRVAGDDLAARRALQRYREAIREVGLSPDEATLMVERLLDSLPAAGVR